MKILFVFLISILSSLSLAQSLTSEQGAAKLKELFAPYVYSLDRPMTTFRYENAQHLAFSPNTIQDVFNRLLPWTSRFFDSNVVDGNEEGPGVYASIDPVATRGGFGGEIPELFVITLKASSVVLDIRTPSNFNHALLDLWKDMGCTSNLSSMQYLDMGTLRNSSDIRCREGLISALKQLHVQVILYAYGAANGFAGCRLTRTEAVNIIAPEIIDLNQLAYYSATQKLESPALNSQMALMANAIYREGLQDLTIAMYSSPLDEPAALADAPAPDNASYARWKNKYIFKCGPPRAREATEGDFIIQAAREAAGNNDFLKLQYAMTKAFHNHNPNMYLDIQRLKALQVAEYRFSGMASDDSKFESWQSGFNIARSSSYANLPLNQSLAQAEQLFQEPSSLISYVDYTTLTTDVMTEVIKHSRTGIFTKNIGFLIQAFLRRGLSERTTEVLVDSILLQSNLPPLVWGELPKDPNRDYSVQMARNKVMAEKILNHCIDIYNNPQTTAQDFQTGECSLQGP